MNARSSWYAEGLRWMGRLLNDAADFIDREVPEPMPRHTSSEEILADVRNRINSGFAAPAAWHRHS